MANAKQEQVLYKEQIKVEKAIHKDRQNLTKAEKELADKKAKGKNDSTVAKTEMKKLNAETDLQKDLERKKIIEAKLGNPLPPTSSTSSSSTDTTTSTSRGIPASGTTTIEHGLIHSDLKSMDQTVAGNKVIEHIHPTQTEQTVTRHDAPVERTTIVEREIVPNETVEMHRHIHPIEEVNVHENHVQRETELVREKVHQTHVKEVHEHYHPRTEREIEKEVVHPEKVVEMDRVVDNGEVSRNVESRDILGRS